jgi:lipopolysaccharide export system permease protein
MILTKIWERYFLKEMAKIFFLFLFCFYGLYVLIDYAGHTSALPHHQTQIRWQELMRYYFFVLASRAEILIPFALLIALIKTLCTLNTSRELLALMAGGFKLPILIRPFLFIGLFFTTLLFLNEQFLLPTALKKLRYIEDATKHQSSRNKLALSVRHLLLEDGSLFLFQSYDTAKNRFFDAYWVRSVDNIYRIKYLYPYVDPPMGHFVDHLIRQPSGELLPQESFDQFNFAAIRFNKQVLQSTLIDSDALSLSELWSQLPSYSQPLTEKESKLLTAFYWKIIMPWLCVLAILAPIPFCLSFSRLLPVFFIYVCGVFGLIAFYLFMDAAQVIAKRQVLPPLWALVVPFLSVFSFFTWRVLKCVK